MRIPFLSDWLSPPQIEQRTDALELQQGVATGSGGSVANLITGMGTSRDSTSYSRPNVGRAYISREETFALMRGGLYRRIASIRPAWATRAGWTIDSDTVKDAFSDLGVQKLVRTADTWGRGTGEYRLWLVTDARDESKPLRKSETIRAIQPLDRREFWPASYSNDLFSRFYGRPDSYIVAPRRAGIASAQKTVHASRMLEFYGHDLAPSEYGVEGWGDRDAVAQVIWAALSGLDTTTNAGARIASELLISVFMMSGMQDIGTSDQAETLIDRIRGTNLMKSIANAIYLGADEKFERQPGNVAGYRDLSDQARLMLAAVEGTPQTLLYGMAPAGFNTDGDSWQEMWHADVAQHQEDRYREPLEYLAWHINGGSDVDLQFKPLGEMDEFERAQLRLAVTQADDVAVTMGAMTPEEHRMRYGEGGRFMAEFEEGLPEEMPEPEVEPIDPEVEASARAMVEAAAGAATIEGEPRTDGLTSAWIGIKVDPAALPDLPADAHVTLLYIGDVDPSDGEVEADIQRAVLRLAEDFGPVASQEFTRTAFAPGPDGMPEIYLVDDGWTLREMWQRLLVALAHRVTSRQRDTYRPHITVRYLPADSQAPEPSAIRTPEPVTMAVVHAKIGGRVVMEATLGAR